jgi:ABC-type phosphate/phosphonate transport system permease subunit
MQSVVRMVEVHTMPTLIVFIIRHFANGFLLGAAAALAAILLQPASMAAQLVSESFAGIWLIVFALGSSFGMGSLATALWLDVES